MRHHSGLSLLALTSAVFSSLLAVSSTPARAQTQVVPSRSFEADLFQPAIGPRNFFLVDAPEVPGHKQLSLGAIFDFQRNAYDVYAIDGNTGRALQTSHLVATQYKTEIQAAIGLLDQFQLGLSLPITASLGGDEVDASMGLATGTRYTASGIGDLRFEAKGILTTAGRDDEFVLAGLLGGTAPTGQKDFYLGNDGPTGRAKLLASLQSGRTRIAAQVGGLLRKSVTTLEANVGSQLLYGGAASFLVMKGFEVMGEVSGRSGLADFGQLWWDENPVEADLGARAYPIGMLALTGGLGMGFGKGIGAPKGRLFLGAVFSPDFRDADHDGIYDIDDRCPDQPEDHDGWKDKDGCPDLDNDNDGIPDAIDKCPNDPEDLDQFEDEDGCPEPDNDHDGILDINDPCPNAAEDGLGKRPHDGCPSTSEDSDGDGVPDTADKCPDEPEDRDNFQDEDGCPDPDNDGDGIPDAFDNCPNEAEDADGFEDEDGCPDPDNDKDGIPDGEDKCPNKPETLNGNQDDDGCPDAGAEIVRLREDSIEVLERIHFTNRGGQIVLKDSAADAVGLVALVLKGHPEITKLRIEVRADGVPKEETQRRAEVVRDVLVQRGVAAARLVPVGAGSGNARVSFIILDKKIPRPAGGDSAAPAKPAGPATF